MKLSWSFPKTFGNGNSVGFFCCFFFSRDARKALQFSEYFGLPFPKLSADSTRTIPAKLISCCYPSKDVFPCPGLSTYEEFPSSSTCGRRSRVQTFGINPDSHPVSPCLLRPCHILRAKGIIPALQGDEAGFSSHPGARDRWTIPGRCAAPSQSSPCFG